MGYDVKIIKPEELDSKFKSATNYSNKELKENIEEAKLTIIIYCMLLHDKQDIKMLQYHLNWLIMLLEDQTKKYIETNIAKDEDFWLCGWKYSRSCDFTKEEIVNRTIEDLTILAYIVKTPDYFDEREKFYDKLNEIKQIIDIDEEISELIFHDLLDMYKGEESY